MHRGSTPAEMTTSKAADNMTKNEWWWFHDIDTNTEIAPWFWFPHTKTKFRSHTTEA